MSISELTEQKMMSSNVVMGKQQHQAKEILITITRGQAETGESFFFLL